MMSSRPTTPRFSPRKSASRPSSPSKHPPTSPRKPPASRPSSPSKHPPTSPRKPPTPRKNPPSSPRKNPPSSPRKNPPSSPRKISAKEQRRSPGGEIQHVLAKNGVAPLDEKSLTFIEQVGKGRFKRVYKGLLRQQGSADPRDVVVLQYKKLGSEVNELSLLALLAGRACGAPHVPQVFGAVDQRTVLCVIQERAVMGNVKSALQSPDIASLFTAQHKLNAAMNVANALSFLQSMRIVHADLACRNLLLFHLDQDPCTIDVKITDFGLAIVLPESCSSEFKKQPQATRWCSPETVTSSKYSFKSDMWSFGICLWELFADGAVPWTRFTKRSDVTSMLAELAQHPDTNNPASAVSVDFPFPETCPWDAYEVFLSCLRIDEKSRIKAEQAADEFQGLVQAEMLQSELSASEIDLSNTNQDDLATSLSTQASMIEGMDSSEAPVTMKLVRDLSCKLMESNENLRGSKQEQSEAKLKVVSDFLWSPYALSVLGNQRVEKMQHEVVSALGKALPKDIAKKKDHPAEKPEGPLLRDLILPPEEHQDYVQCWATAPPLSVWTLWSLAENHMLRRQDFATESAARAAYQAGHWSSVLQGPEDLYANNG